MPYEDFNREEHVEASSDRSFGLVSAGVFLIIAAWPALHAGPPRRWAGAVAAVFALVAWLRRALLAGLNRWWMKLGLLLGHIVSPIALGVLFYDVLTSVGVVMRAFFGKDPPLHIELYLSHDITTALPASSTQ
jgi:hypothetical protein